MSASESPLFPDYQIQVHETVVSTNDEAKRVAAAGAADSTVIVAREQVGGRGRHGRQWYSPPGNLYMSVVLRDKRPAAQAMLIGFVAGVALVRSVAYFLPHDPHAQTKWPNDVLVDGRKIAGILIETSTNSEGGFDWLVLGVGVNVASFPADTTFPATSLQAAGVDPAIMADEVGARFLVELAMWRRLWAEEGFDLIREAWLNHAWRLGKSIEIKRGETALRGVFRTLDPQGALVLDVKSGGTEMIHYGDVFAGD